MNIEHQNMQLDDFDFIIGSWTVEHSRLKERLNGCQEWIGFSGQSTTTKILSGLGNLEDNLLHLPEGDYRAAAFRSYDLFMKSSQEVTIASQKWSNWLSAREDGL